MKMLLPHIPTGGNCIRVSKTEEKEFSPPKDYKITFVVKKKQDLINIINIDILLIFQNKGQFSLWFTCQWLICLLFWDTNETNNMLVPGGQMLLTLRVDKRFLYKQRGKILAWWCWSHWGWESYEDANIPANKVRKASGEVRILISYIITLQYLKYIKYYKFSWKKLEQVEFNY